MDRSGNEELTIHVWPSDEGYMFDIWKGEPSDAHRDADDGGVCTGTLKRALKMASDQAFALITPSDALGKIKSVDDWWTCICGNQPDREGFFPCNAEGDQVEPTPAEWKKPLYVCASCGRIINQKTLDVIGRNPSSQLLRQSGPKRASALGNRLRA
jgi:hypothetical protein